MVTKTELLSRINADYNETIVDINPAVLPGLVIPAEGFALPGTPADYIANNFGLDAAISFLIALNSINYCFWQRKPDGTVDRYVYRDRVGAHGMTAAFQNAWGDFGTPVLLRHNFEVGGIDDMFGDIPMKMSREAILESVLSDKRLEDATTILRMRLDARATPAFTVEDASFLADAFPLAYGDRYLKKAQLTMMEIASLYKALPHQLDLTVAADYQLPKVLRDMGILVYSTNLANMVDSGQYISAGSAEEHAIRSATVIACNIISKMHNISTPALDWWIWSHRNDFPGRIHLTITSDY